MQTVTEYHPATDRQIEFILDLLGKREMAAEARDAALHRVLLLGKHEDARRLPKAAASAWIDRLLELPKIQDKPKADAAPAKDHDVPSGHYAIVVAGEDKAVTKFYKVDNVVEGRWAGHTFVKAQAGDEFHPVRGGARDNVLEIIARDPEGASKLYGKEIGRCGICNRTLTDPESRERGIGPVCAENVGW